MIRENDTKLAVLVVEDVTETRDGIEKLLKADGYRVAGSQESRTRWQREGLLNPAETTCQIKKER
jgi:CheY-like chemotaxis protein